MYVQSCLVSCWVLKLFGWSATLSCDDQYSDNCRYKKAMLFFFHFYNSRRLKELVNVWARRTEASIDEDLPFVLPVLIPRTRRHKVLQVKSNFTYSRPKFTEKGEASTRIPRTRPPGHLQYFLPGTGNLLDMLSALIVEKIPVLHVIWRLELYEYIRSFLARFKYLFKHTNRWKLLLLSWRP